MPREMGFRVVDFASNICSGLAAEKASPKTVGTSETVNLDIIQYNDLQFTETNAQANIHGDSAGVLPSPLSLRMTTRGVILR